MDRGLVGAITHLVNSASEIVEAHLPQCYVPVSMEQPAQVLIVVLDAEVHAEHAVKALQEGMRCLTFPGGHLYIWPLSPGSNLLPAVRNAGCSLKSVSSAGSELHPQPRKWWKIR